MRALQVRVLADPTLAYTGVVAQRLLLRDPYPCPCLTVGD
jgi:hypothetical protein